MRPVWNLQHPTFVLEKPKLLQTINLVVQTIKKINFPKLVRLTDLTIGKTRKKFQYFFGSFVIAQVQIAETHFF